MGCTPSVHVSQNTGIVICSRDGSVESQASGLQPVCVVKRLSDCSVTISAELLGQEISSKRRSSCVTVTQTTTGLVVTHVAPEVSKALLGTSEEPSIDLDTIEMEPSKALAEELEGSTCELFGALKVNKFPMEVQLVFGSEDSQSQAFTAAAKKGGYKCKLHTTSETALDYYLKRLPELVIIDLRTTSPFDGEQLCRTMREQKPDVGTVVMGVVKKTQEDTPIAGLLSAGFNRRYVENHNVTSCHNELLMIDKGEVSLHCKLRATSCLFSAAENAYDAIEIQCVDPDRDDFQYVNPACEKVTGYYKTEVQSGLKNNFLSNCELPKPDSHETISKVLSKGKTWEGVCIACKKSGEQFVQNLKIVPFIGHAGRVTHYIIIKRDLTALDNDTNIQELHQELRKTQTERRLDIRMSQMSTDRRSSSQSGLAVPSSLSLNPEAPITKVINMLNAVQESSPLNVVTVLEKVIDILRTTELYTPTALEDVEGKGNETDLVEGLMWNKRRRSAAEVNAKGLAHRDSASQVTPLVSPDKGMQRFEAPPEIVDALRGCDQWDYDVINLETISGNRPLYHLGRRLFEQFNVPEYLSVSESVIRNWLQLIEGNYHVHNSYHNSTHAADVLQATSVFLKKPDVKAVLDHTDEVASLIAAVVHDVDHPGFTNSHLCNAGNGLAILYNDIAVLESHHAAMAFKLTAKDQKSNIFQNIDADQFKLIRQSVIDMVMATEMKQHFEHLAKFDNNFNKRHSIHEDTASTNGRGTPESTTSNINFSSPENKGVLRRMLIKCSDIGNPARPNSLCTKWAYRIAEEYFKQTEEEEKLGLPIVMPVFDRKTCNIPKSQLFFMDYFVMNLYQAWDGYVHCTDAMEFLRLNYEYWSREADTWEQQER